MGQIHSHRNLLKPNFKHNALALESGRGGGIQQCVILEALPRGPTQAHSQSYTNLCQTTITFYGKASITLPLRTR